MAQPFCCFVDSIIRPSHYCYAINLTPNSFSNLVKKGSEYAIAKRIEMITKTSHKPQWAAIVFTDGWVFYQLEANPKDEG